MERPDQHRGKWQRWGPVMGYLLLGAAAAAMNLLSGRLFTGECPDALAFAFLYPLFGGSAMHLLLALLVPDAWESEYNPIFLGLYNAGILLLTANQAAAGFLELAGRESSYISLMAIIGWTLSAAGMMVLAMVVWDVHGSRKNRHAGNEKPGWMKEEHHE